MYGMVNKGVKDLVLSAFGAEKWTEICRKAGITQDEFGAMEAYSDDVTYRLVGAASEVLGLSASAILQEFGKHWIKYTAGQGYGPLMDMFGDDFFEAISNINNLHQRVGLSMPHLSAPKFKINRLSPSELMLEYISQREGLSPMMIGLLYGLADKHNEKITVEYFPAGVKAENETFLVKKV